MRAELIGVPGANGRGGPLTGTPAAAFSTNLGLHGPEINKRAVTAITTKAAAIAQLILLIRTSPAILNVAIRPDDGDAVLLHLLAPTETETAIKRRTVRPVPARQLAPSEDYRFCISSRTPRAPSWGQCCRQLRMHCGLTRPS